MRETIFMKKNSGFTLMELLVTIGIIGIMSAIAVPNYISWLPKQRISGASRDIYSAIQFARIRAVKERTPVVIRFTMGVGAAGGFTVFEDSVTLDGICQPAERILKNKTMPGDVDLSSATFAGGVPWTRFNTRGLPVGLGGNVTIQNVQSNLYRRIVVRTTGTPDIRVSTDGGVNYLDI